MQKPMTSIYLAVELKQQLVEEAKSKGLSLNGYITMILMKREK